ncbi:type I pullulanase [Fuchsiella alkaliacetigena]|uniref:type I pullulanase n=1 Tax=Fuchsiella alkaliacetigena TaxID=957042 RepID=UPI00200A7450|nr:type I pullulanase [Fuchsiella alkaliacetigena]MCK8823586.1 type I pullulanase [Fuchsiella alkaliacetigena]
MNYLDKKVGIYYSQEKTEFHVWAPNVDQVKLLLYEINGKYENPGQVFNMEQDSDGIWSITVSGDHKGKFYNYLVEDRNDLKCAVDPYAQAVSLNGTKGVIVDLAETNPEGWEDDQRPPLENLEDSIIYEIHVKDFSISPYSGMENKGKYLAFTELGTTVPGTDIKTGVAHLKELGITHVHLLPVFDFGSVDERLDYQYNWGYDPQNYNVPEGLYATDPSQPKTRIRELKRLIQSLHQNGIRVIMDVVYNHTYRLYESNFGKLAPQEYYRFYEEGEPANGSGCGNEIASENPMVRKFIVDSVEYWAREYHIDGFRFDLMGLIDQKTMEAVANRLHEIDPSILIYGEPWTADKSPLPIDQRMLKGRQRGLKIGVFNDDLRDTIKGGTRGKAKGYVNGELANLDYLKSGITAQISSYASSPHEVINYVSSHDDLTLWDKIEKTCPQASYEDKVRMSNLSNAIVLTSQGIPFLHGGVDLLRTKYGVENSYQSSDRINKIDWVKKIDNNYVFKYYQGLIKLRKEHPAFRMASAEDIKKHLQFLEADYGIIAFQLQGYANNDSWETIIVVYNPFMEARDIRLPESKNWEIVVKDKKAGTETLESFYGQMVLVPKISTMVLHD